MNNILIAFCMLLLLAPRLSLAKEKTDTTYQYFDASWTKTKKKNAQYYAKIWPEGNGWHRQDYYASNDQLQMDGHYLDADFTMQHGAFTFYYEDGKTQQMASFDHNLKIGQDAVWFENGKSQQLSHYKNGSLVDSNMAWYANGQLSTIAVLDGNGTGTGEEFLDDGIKIGGGAYIRGKRQGVWTFNDSKQALTQIIEYNQDSAVLIKNYDEKGVETKADRNSDRLAEFPGGLEGYKQYLVQNVRYPEQSQKKGVHGVAVLEMVVDKTGKVTAVTLLNAPDAATGAEALRVLQHSPHWIPAIQHNRNVTCRFTQRITFALK